MRTEGIDLYTQTTSSDELGGISSSEMLLRSTWAEVRIVNSYNTNTGAEQSDNYTIEFITRSGLDYSTTITSITENISSVGYKAKRYRVQERPLPDRPGYIKLVATYGV